MNTLSLDIKKDSVQDKETAKSGLVGKKWVKKGGKSDEKANANSKSVRCVYTFTSNKLSTNSNGIQFELQHQNCNRNNHCDLQTKYHIQPANNYSNHDSFVDKNKKKSVEKKNNNKLGIFNFKTI